MSSGCCWGALRFSRLSFFLLGFFSEQDCHTSGQWSGNLSSSMPDAANPFGDSVFTVRLATHLRVVVIFSPDAHAVSGWSRR